MVKGNWERRVEQAQLRREENKAKKGESPPVRVVLARRGCPLCWNIQTGCML